MDKTGTEPTIINPKDRLLEELYYLRKELNKNDFICAYNRLTRVRKEISSLPSKKQFNEVKNELQTLNTEFNISLLQYLSDNK